MSRTANGIGWGIQEHSLPNGWRFIGRLYLSKGAAHDAMIAMGDDKLRVYEVLS